MMTKSKNGKNGVALETRLKGIYLFQGSEVR